MDNPSPAPTDKDFNLAQQSFKFLWRQRQMYQFILKGINKRRKELDQEEAEAQQKIKFFNLRIAKEFERHGDALEKFGLKATSEEDDEN